MRNLSPGAASHLGIPPWPATCQPLDSLRWTDLGPPFYAPLPHLQALTHSLTSHSGCVSRTCQDSVLGSGPTGLAVLLLMGVGQWGRVGIDLLLQASFPPFYPGGKGGEQD